MIAADLQNGVSFSLLLAVIASTNPEFAGEIKKKYLEWANQPSNSLYADFLSTLSSTAENTTPDSFVRSLHDACRKLPPLAAHDLPWFDEQLDQEVQQTVTCSGLKFLDPFEFCAYISCTVTLQRQLHKLKIFTPAVSKDSEKECFSILRNAKMILTEHAPKISPLLASFLFGRFHPFLVSTVPCSVDKVEEVIDPLDPGLQARLFSLKDEIGETGSIAVIEANIDDMTPELIAEAMQILMKNNALDFAILPVVMKKGRPGFMVQVLAGTKDREKIENLLLSHTSTFGVRTTFAARRVLQRSIEEYNSSYGKIRVKKGLMNGYVVRCVPEFEDIAALSRAKGIPALKLYTDIISEIDREHLSSREQS